jgi:hypothetical protein
MRIIKSNKSSPSNVVIYKSNLYIEELKKEIERLRHDKSSLD